MRSTLWFLVGLTFLLIVWGAVVRGTGSGLGCPDWPLCYGKIIPPFEKEILIEYVHRLFASLVGFLTLGICVAIWCKDKFRRLVGKYAALALILLFSQVGLGAITVKSELHPHVVATHMAVALLFFTAVLHMRLKMREAYFVEPISPPLPAPCFLVLTSRLTYTLLFFQIVLGSLVAASNAGLACPDFPTCQGKWWVGLSGLVGIHFLHRLGAVVTFVLIVLLSFGSMKRCRPLSVLLLTFGALQILLGIGNVLMGLPLWMRVLHTAVALALFAFLIATHHVLNHPKLYPTD